MTELLLLALALFFAAQLIWTWSFRGGSMPEWWSYNSRRIERLLATTVALALALLCAFGPEKWYFLLLGAVLFLAAQTPGWGRQMDLGRTHKPDDEWGARIRDLFFEEKSSYRRDLVGLYMRMSYFLPSAIALYFYHSWAAVIPIVLWIGSVQIWVLEYKKFWAKDLIPPKPFGFHSWTEWWIGILLFVTTAGVIVAS